MIKSVIPAVLLVLFSIVTPLAQADEPAKPAFKIFKNFSEAVAFYKASGQLPHGTAVYTGYSLEPFGSRDKALAEAQEKAQKAGSSGGFITQDGRHTYDTPPPETHWPGTYDMVSLAALTPVALNSRNSRG